MTIYAVIILSVSLNVSLCVSAPSESTQTDTGRIEPEKAQETKFDDTTPEVAIRSFYTALAKGDAKSARKLLVSPEKMIEWTEIQAKLSVEFKRFGSAAVEEFGDDGKVLQVPVPAETARQKDAQWPISHP